MRLTRQSEIAIGILAICAVRQTSKLRTQYLADRTGTSKDHAAQVVSLLARNGLLACVRGRGGGVRLAVDPQTVAIAEVIRLTQPELIHDANVGQSQHVSGTVGLDMIVEASSAFFARLVDRFTIADLVAREGTSPIGCLDCSLVNPARMPAQRKTPSTTAYPIAAARPHMQAADGRSITVERFSRHDQAHS